MLGSICINRVSVSNFDFKTPSTFIISVVSPFRTASSKRKIEGSVPGVCTQIDSKVQPTRSSAHSATQLFTEQHHTLRRNRAPPGSGSLMYLRHSSEKLGQADR